MTGLATSEERSSGMAAGSILSMGSRTRFWIVRIRRECDIAWLGWGRSSWRCFVVWEGAKAYRKEYERNKHLLLINGDIVL